MNDVVTLELGATYIENQARLTNHLGIIRWNQTTRIHNMF